MDLIIPTLSGDPLSIQLDAGEQVYIVGANGTGKSALFQHWVTSLDDLDIRRIVAHRQTWFESGSPEVTPRKRQELEAAVRGWDTSDSARWIDHSSASRQSAMFFDLMAKENTRAREIARLVGGGRSDEALYFASKSQSSFKQLNDLLALGHLDISLSNLDDKEIVAQHRDNNSHFSIAQMSDGERAAVLMAAEVLTVEPGTVFLIDEPERHLHRSIIESFLSALFANRQDCAFVISTHEIALPIANSAANVIILRSCVWNGNQARAWGAEVLDAGTSLPEDLKRDILGARRRILFVEGVANSLDLPLYSALFPELSVIPKGNCDGVISAVKGLRGSYEHHHVEAFGLIDRDDRTEDTVRELAQDSIMALDVYSVESLYYCSSAIEAVARRQAESLDCEPSVMIQAATQRALQAITSEEGLPERMAARRSERMAYNRFTTHLPDWRAIKAAGAQLSISEPIENPYQDELHRFNGLVELRDLNGLIARYPLRESSVFDRIATSLGCRNRADYERMVAARVREDAGLITELKQRIRSLAELLDGGTNDGTLKT